MATSGFAFLVIFLFWALRRKDLFGIMFYFFKASGRQIQGSFMYNIMFPSGVLFDCFSLVWFELVQYCSWFGLVVVVGFDGCGSGRSADAPLKLERLWPSTRGAFSGPWEKKLNQALSN